MLKVVLRFQPAAAHQSVGDTDGCGGSELDSYVEIIILLQKRILKDVEEVTLVLIPVLIRKLGGNSFQLLPQAVCAGNIVSTLQHCGDTVRMLRAKLPQPDSTGVFQTAGIRHIEHIAELRLVASGVNECNTLGATAHIPTHGLIPDIVFGAGGGVGPLGVDHDLFVVGILVQPCGGGEKIRPSLIAPGELPGGFFRHLAVCL